MVTRMADTVRGVVAEIENSLISSQGTSQQEAQKRLSEVVSTLLDFWSRKRIVAWMLKKNSGLRNEAPIDLIGSAYATKDLISVVREIKQKRLAKKNKFARLRRLLRTPSVLETGANVPLREKLRGKTVDPGPPPDCPHNRPSADCRTS